MVNIYCDESCHLEHDGFDKMFLGAISCPKQEVRKVSRDIRNIKIKYGLSRNFEIKWTKVSPGQLKLYSELISYFFENINLQFRCVIATHKDQLDNDRFHQTYDDWYYKMYYQLLNKLIDQTQEYNVYVDIKDTNGGPKIRQLKKIINNLLHDFYSRCLKNIQIIKSNESELLQLCDLLMGAVSYKNRFNNVEYQKSHQLSDAKVILCNQISRSTKCDLQSKTSLFNTKFNLFVWEPRGDR